MLLRQYFHQESGTLSYLIADQQKGQALLIDPVFEQVTLYLEQLDQLGLKLIYALDTHIHADHITALGILQKETQCDTVQGQESQALGISLPVKDQYMIRMGQVEIRCLHTPGHTEESYCFLLIPQEKQMPLSIFTGDTLLVRATGRTDFQGGDPIAQYNSIHDKLLSLPDKTLVYPGHNYQGIHSTTIGEERRFNPRLQASSPDIYAKIMTNLNLPDPEMMSIAVPANQHLGLKNNELS